MYLIYTKIINLALPLFAAAATLATIGATVHIYEKYEFTEIPEVRAENVRHMLNVTQMEVNEASARLSDLKRQCITAKVCKVERKDTGAILVSWPDTNMRNEFLNILKTQKNEY